MSRKQKVSKRKKRAFPPTHSTRLSRLIPIALAVGLLVVGLSAWLTPPQEDESSTDASADSAAISVPDPRSAQAAHDTLADDGAIALPGGAKPQRPPESAGTELRTPLEDEAEVVEAAELERQLVKLANEIVRLYRQDSKVHHVAGQIFTEFNQTQLARLSWQRCIDLKPTNPGPYIGLAELLQSAGEDSHSLEILAKAEAVNIRSPELALSIATAHENLGQVEQALQTLNAGARQFPENAALCGSLGRLESQSGELANAELNLRKALYLGGEDRKVLSLLVTTLARQKKRDEAEVFRKQLTAINAEHKPTTNQSAGEDETFRAAYDLAAQQFAYHMFLQAAAIAEHEQDWEAAELWAHRSQALQPKDPQCYHVLSSIYRTQGKLAAAIATQKRLVRLQPRDVVQHTNLASLAFQNRDMLLAERTLIDAIAIDPNGHSAASALAQLYLARRDFHSAQKVALDLVRRNRTSVDSYLLLGSVSNAIGDQASANSALVKARQLEPNHPAFRSMLGASQ